MIISASRRTDIPALYADWFFRRIREGYVYVRNPMNPRRVSEISLSPDVVDGIVFWTKNPTPMLDRLDALREYPFYFQFTLTPYGCDVERNVPSKNDVLIPAFLTLSSRIGKERVVWRYDPILFSEKYSLEYHKKYFRLLCSRLAAYTEKCTVSFLDIYKNIRRSTDSLGLRPPTDGERDELAGYLGEIAAVHGLTMDTCAEEADLSRYGIGHASCIDAARLERISGVRLDIGRDKNQRPACGCASAMDIGAYNTCTNGCAYCYANYSSSLMRYACSRYDPASPLLCGEITSEDVITPREMKSLRAVQTSITE